MEILQITFDELEKYNQIEMLKIFDYYRDYRNKSNMEYDIKKTPKTIIDFAKDEKMSLWKEILNENTTGVFVIKENNEWVAGCVVVTHSPKVNMLRNDMSNAVLWDIRVDSNHQKKGYGSILFNKAEEYAKSQNCAQMIIETQNNNPKAIEFYEKNGAVLKEINFYHYKDLPDEDQLIYIKEL